MEPLAAADAVNTEMSPDSPELELPAAPQPRAVQSSLRGLLAPERRREAAGLAAIAVPVVSAGTPRPPPARPDRRPAPGAVGEALGWGFPLSRRILHAAGPGVSAPAGLSFLSLRSFLPS